MQQTCNAVLQPNGSLQFLDRLAMPARHAQRVLVTFTGEPFSTEAALCGTNPGEADLAPGKESEGPAWQDFAGALKNSPHFNGDPLSIQQAMRDDRN